MDDLSQFKVKNKDIRLINLRNETLNPVRVSIRRTSDGSIIIYMKPGYTGEHVPTPGEANLLSGDFIDWKLEDINMLDEQ
jgi:hypothetical protein